MLRSDTRVLSLVTAIGVVCAWATPSPARAEVRNPYRLEGPKVAANPQDKWVLAYWKRVVVITQDGGVFAHDVTHGGPFDGTVGVPYRLEGPKVAANPQDKWVLPMGESVVVITQDGGVFVHDLDFGKKTVGTARQLKGPKVAARPEDKWVLVMGNSIVVITRDGGVFAHDTKGDAVGEPYQLKGPKVASRPEDKWVLGMDGRQGADGSHVLVITANGKVHVHDIGIVGKNVGDPYQLTSPKVAANPQDKWVFPMDNKRIVVVTRDGGVFAHFIEEWEIIK